MAAKRRFLDVWIVESNTVYREVPFVVVGDWVQQGRLVADDMLRPSGTAQWVRLGGMPSFAAYLPQSQPYRVEDKAEALEPVQLDFGWKRRPEEDEGDVDMVPLIDVSLVLLIFFMMISSVAAASKWFDLPIVQNPGTMDPKTLWVSIENGPGNSHVYSLGAGNKAEKLVDLDQKTQDKAVLLRSLDRYLEGKSGVDVRIRAQRDVLCDPVMELLGDVQSRRPRVGAIYKDVNEQPR